MGVLEQCGCRAGASRRLRGPRASVRDRELSTRDRVVDRRAAARVVPAIGGAGSKRRPPGGGCEPIAAGSGAATSTNIRDQVRGEAHHPLIGWSRARSRTAKGSDGTGEGFYVQLRYPAGRRWIAVAVSQDRRNAVHLGAQAYRHRAGPRGKTPSGVRVMSLADLRAEGGDEAVSRADFDLWERAAN
jgi:hypothetical protein